MFLMKFVVTGGSGFIGSHITKFLLKKNHDVIVIDNFYHEKNSNLDDVKQFIEFHNVDIRNYEDLSSIIKNVDGIFHEAGLTSVQDSFKNPNEYHSVNVIGSENIFKISQQLEIKTVFASSAAVYGPQTNIPIKEDSEKNPVNPYGHSKLDSEKISEKYQENNKIIGLRYFNAYGPCQSIDYAGVIQKFLDNISKNENLSIFGNGLQVRDFIHVDDIVEANYHAIKSSKDFGFFNIGSGTSISIKELANLMIELSGKNLKIQYKELPQGDVKLSQADIKLAKQFLNWEPKISIKEGLKNLLE